MILIVQFQPREFSAIIGAEICAVRAELPVRPLPLLFRSLPGLVRPPDMKAPAPPKSAGLPECLISGPTIELDRRWLCLRFLYLRATKNIAAPYAADAPTAAIAIPAVVLAAFGDWLWLLVWSSPLLPEGVVEVAAEELPVPVAPLSIVEPGIKGIAGLMRFINEAILGSPLL